MPASTAAAALPEPDGVLDADRRAATRVRVTYRMVVRSAGEETTAFTTDVSVSGAFLETTRPLEVGAVAQLSFTVTQRNERHPVEAEGVVVRRLSVEEARQTGGLPGVGVAFTRFLWGGEAFAAALAGLLQEETALPAATRRRQRRAAVGLPIWWGHEGRRQAGVLTNLSAAGAFFIETEATVTAGAALNLWFEVPVDGRARPVKATARVTRVVSGRDPVTQAATSGMAVALEVSPFDHRTLAAFLDRRLNRPAPVLRRLEATHPTRLDGLFAAAVAEWEEKGLEAVGATAEAVRDGSPDAGRGASTDGSDCSPTGAPPAPRGPRRTAAAPPLSSSPPAERGADVCWARVAAAALKGSGLMVLALLAAFVAALLQLV